MTFVVPQFNLARVLVVGDLMLDSYWHGVSTRISPEAPVPIVKIAQSEERIGGAGNVALNLSSLGVSVVIVGIIGNDDDGKTLQVKLESADICCDLQISISKPTIKKLRIISQHQHLLRLDFEEQFTVEDSSQIFKKVEALISGSGVLVLSDYAKGSLQDPRSLIKLAHKYKIPVLVDPKGVDFERYRGATLLTPNFSEFQAVAGVCTNEQILAEKGNALMVSLDIAALLITRSEKA